MDTTPPPMTPPGAAAVPPPSSMPPAASATEDKTVAILSYITLLGFIAAIIIHSNKKTQLGAFHLRQALGLFLTGILMVIPLLNILVGICLLILWIMGLISAIQGQMKPVPVLGPLYQKWFGSAFN
jgi:uncharacterized membrane protein